MSKGPLVALIRHGAYHQKDNAPSAWQPFPLTDFGEQETRRQASLFAEELRKQGWKLAPRVHSSNLLRAWQTARIYIEVLSEFFDEEVEHEESPLLCERSVGSVANLTTAEIEGVMAQDPRFALPPKGWKSDSHYCLPFTGAESLMQAGLRVSRYILDNIQAYQEGQVQIFVGHGAAIRHAACHLNVMEICDVSKLSMYHAHPVVLQRVDNQWHKVSGNWKIRKQGSEVTD